MKYIYIDESGDLGDKYSSSKYFVLAAIVVNNPKNLNRIIKETKRKYSDIIGRDLEVKGNKTDRNVPGFYNYNVLYDVLASKLAEKIIINSPTNVIVDRSKSKYEQILVFNERFSSCLNNPDNFSVNINHANSINYKGLQIADIIAWSIFQSLEYGNSEFINLIRNKNVSEVFKR